jgi:tetratricopeptide (TPR) repeat protein
MPQPAAHVQARAAAERALRLDPGLGEPHAALGLVAKFEWKWEEAEREYRRAVELAPGYATAHHWYGLFLLTRGRMKEAFATLERARELDPLSFPIQMAIGTALGYDRRYEEAIDLYRKVLEMDPGYVPARSNLSGVFVHLGRYGETLEEFEVLARLAPDFAPADWVSELRQGYMALGEKGFWEAYLEGLRARPGTVLGGKFEMAFACAQLGKIDDAFALIDDLLAERSPLSEQLAGNPGFDPLQSDPRWEKVLERMGLR